MSEAAVASAEVVDMGGVFDAMDLRRFKSGSVAATSTSAIVKLLIKDQLEMKAWYLELMIRTSEPDEYMYSRFIKRCPKKIKGCYNVMDVSYDFIALNSLCVSTFTRVYLR